MTTGAKASLAAGVLIIIAAAVALYLWTTRARFEVVLHEAQRSGIARAEQELSASNIPFKESEDGLSLLVAEENSAKARIILADLGLPFENTVGLEMFETSDFGVTEFAQQINFKRALEGELTRTISAMHEVRYARVHLVLPEKGLLKQDNVPASAAVTMFLRNGLKMSPEQIEGIQRLIVASVPELKIENVTILDQRGNTLSVGSDQSPSRKVSSEQSRIEERLRNKIQNMLAQQFSPDAFNVSVSAEINRQAMRRVEERPVMAIEGRGALTHKTQSTEYLDENSKPTTRIEENFEYGVIREETDIPEGSVTRLSVAVWLSASLTLEQQQELKELIRTVAGAIDERDIITLMVTPSVSGDVSVSNTTEFSMPEPLPIQRSAENTPGQSESVPVGLPYVVEIRGFGINLLYVFSTMAFLLVIALLVIAKLLFDMRRMRLTKGQRDVLLSQLNQILYEQKSD